VEKMVKLALEAGTPLFEDVMRSIASICGVDYGEAWRYANKLAMSRREEMAPMRATPEKRVERPCWRCPACGREFESYAKLVNHILYFVRRGDKAHRKTYYEIKSEADRQGKKFSEVVAERFRCS